MLMDSLESLMLEVTERYLFVWAAVIGACAIAGGIGWMALKALLWLAECMASDGEDEKRTFL